MKKQNPRVILLIDTNRAYERGLIRGILKYSRLHGPWTLLRRTPVAAGGQPQVTLSELKNWNADGIIWREAASPIRFDELDIPMVYASGATVSDKGPNILTNDIAIGRMAAEHLLGLQFRNFAFYGIGSRFHWTAGRKTGFAERVKEAGYNVSIYELNSKTASLPRKEQQKHLQDWLASLPRPFGLMLCTDDCGIDCFEACRAEKIDIPSDAAVIGVGNDELICDFVDPPLSSITWNIEQTGYEAAEVLANMMRGGPKDAIHDVSADPLHVVTRMSTDTLAIKDKDIAKAVQFINTNASHNIHVDDVLKVVPVSRRVLYRRFKKVLGRSIYEEIKRARIDRAARMLLETNLSITEIALKLGYDDAKNFSRTFRNQKSLTPLKYRTKYAPYG